MSIIQYTDFNDIAQNVLNLYGISTKAFRLHILIKEKMDRDQWLCFGHIAPTAQCNDENCRLYNVVPTERVKYKAASINQKLFITVSSDGNDIHNSYPGAVTQRNHLQRWFRSFAKPVSKP